MLLDFNQLDFFTVSYRIKDLLERESPLASGIHDAWIRTGISRTYYGVFLYLRSLLKLDTYRVTDVHGKVLEELSKRAREFNFLGKVDIGKKYYIIY